MPNTTLLFGDFIYGVIPQVLLAVGISKICKLKSFAQGSRNKTLEKFLQVAPEATAIASAGFLSAIEIWSPTALHTADLRDLPAALLGSLMGYLSVGRRIKRFWQNYQSDPQWQYIDQVKSELNELSSYRILKRQFGKESDQNS